MEHTITLKLSPKSKKKEKKEKEIVACEIIEL